MDSRCPLSRVSDVTRPDIAITIDTIDESPEVEFHSSFTNWHRITARRSRGRGEANHKIETQESNHGEHGKNGAGQVSRALVFPLVESVLRFMFWFDLAP
jgi:hypothetical protein